MSPRGVGCHSAVDAEQPIRLITNATGSVAVKLATSALILRKVGRDKELP
jgi:hypothetical protein